MLMISYCIDNMSLIVTVASIRLLTTANRILMAILANSLQSMKNKKVRSKYEHITSINTLFILQKQYRFINIKI